MLCNIERLKSPKSPLVSPSCSTLILTKDPGVSTHTIATTCYYEALPVFLVVNMPSLKLLLSVAFFFLSPAAAGRLRTRPRPQHQSRPQPRPRPSPALETIETDVLVIGGGSAGTYGAIRLHDAGKSVVVVEATGKLGGHAQTYVGDNGGVVNVGVQVLYVSGTETTIKLSTGG